MGHGEGDEDDDCRYAGPLPADDARGLHGGACELHVAGDTFALRVERQHAYGIEDTDTVHGVVGPAADGLALATRQWHSVTIETTAVQSLRPLVRDWHAHYAGPVDAPRAALSLAFTLGAESFDVLLLREPADGGAGPPALAAWFARACAMRDAAVATARARRVAGERADRRAATSAQSFAAGDFASVVALLAPEEGTLSRAEAIRLAAARRRLAEGR